MAGIISDLVFSLRLLRKSPSFALTSILTLALAGGAGTVVFSGVECFILQPLPFQQPERLLLMKQVQRDSNGPSTVTAADYLEWSRQARSLDSLGAFQIGVFNWVRRGMEAERVNGCRVDSGFFRTLRVPAHRGRLFSAADDAPQAPAVAIISEGFWRRRFGAAEDILGEDFVIDGVPHTIVGIAPAQLRLPMGFSDVWLPLGPALARTHRGDHFLGVIGRLREGAALNTINSELAAIGRGLEASSPDTNRGWTAQAWPLSEAVSAAARRFLPILALAVALVIVICCTNIANLLLARGAARAREMAVRGALGASRWRLLRQLVIENTVLALLGGAGALLLARWGIDGLSAGLPPLLQPPGGIHFSPAVVGFLLALSLATSLLFGLLPALRLLHTGTAEALKEGPRGGATGLGRSRLASSLVVAEVGLAVLLLTSAGLLVGSLLRMQNENLGFQPRGVLTAEIALKGDRYAHPRSRVLAIDTLLERLQALPGVEVASAINWPPLTSDTERAYAVQGRPLPADGRPAQASYLVATPGYDRAIGLRLIAGRFVQPSDNFQAPPVALVNESLARQLAGNGSALGRHVALYTGPRELGPWMEVVGIFADARQFAPAGPIPPAILMPYAQRPGDSTYLALRTAGDPAAFQHALEQTVKSFDSNLPLSLIRPMERVIADSIAPTRITTATLMSFGAFSLILAGMGLFGVVSYLVAARTHEFGVRMALGAGRSDLLRLVLHRALRLTLSGAALGLLGGLGAGRLLNAMFYGTVRPSPLLFAALALALGGVALLASWFPVRRALQLDPLRALRAE